MKISEKDRQRLNKIVAPYSGWHYEFEIRKMYDELLMTGVEIPMITAYDGEQHEYTYNGEPVDNSLFIFQKYEGRNSDRNEYNIYFS